VQKRRNLGEESDTEFPDIQFDENRDEVVDENDDRNLADVAHAQKKRQLSEFTPQDTDLPTNSELSGDRKLKSQCRTHANNNAHWYSAEAVTTPKGLGWRFYCRYPGCTT